MALAFSVALVAQKKDDKKQSDAQKKEIQDIVKIVDGVAAGQPAPNDLGLSWVHEDFLKANGNKQYVPFTVTFDPVEGDRPDVAFYWRVVSKERPAPLGTRARGREGRQGQERRQESGRPRYAYEDINFIPVTAGQTPTREDQPLVHRAGGHLRRLRGRQGTDARQAPKNAPPPKMSADQADGRRCPTSGTAS